ncbi:MAG: hypothetical protein SOV73_08345, partial [Candidatus Faecivivens sp.]|nr:hypothetical protein [Candidatus Faecivivens sp.]
AEIKGTESLCLHPKPIFMLFHNFRSVPVQIVLRSKTQNIILKKLYLLMSKTSAGTAYLFDYFLGSAARNNWKRNVWETVKKGGNRQKVQAEGFAGRSPLDTHKAFLPDKLALRICYANSIRKIR